VSRDRLRSLRYARYITLVVYKEIRIIYSSGKTKTRAYFRVLVAYLRRLITAFNSAESDVTPKRSAS
jgi:hypothetical protein